jgi:hypothetical protein
MKGEPNSRKAMRLRLEIIKCILSPNASIAILKAMLATYNDLRADEKQSDK